MPSHRVHQTTGKSNGLAEEDGIEEEACEEAASQRADPVDAVNVPMGGGHGWAEGAGGV